MRRAIIAGLWTFTLGCAVYIGQQPVSAASPGDFVVTNRQPVASHCDVPATGSKFFNPCSVLDTTHFIDRRGEATVPGGEDMPGWFCSSYETTAGTGWVCVPPKGN